MAAASPSARPLVVYDCMVFLQGAARRQSPSGLCLTLAEQGHVELCVCRTILREVADVLSRPKVRAKFPTLTGPLVEEFLARILQFSTLVTGVPRYFALDRDPKDEPYLNLACHVGADFLVSRDRDLLDLAAGLPAVPVPVPLPGPPGKLTILEPPAFLQAIRQRQTP